MKNFDKTKLIKILMKASSCMMALAIVAANLSQNSTCLCVFNQPEMPDSLIEKD